LAGLKRSIVWLVNQLLPAACPLCRCSFSPGWQQPFCATCLLGFKPLPAARCPCCALPFPALNQSAHLCGRCSISAPPFSKVHCAGLYELALRKAIHQFKFTQQVGLDRPLARLLAGAIAADCPCELIVPVPLHPRRLRQRCYNQSLLLAREIGRLRGLPVAARLLLKEQDTPPQQGLSAAAREKNLRHVFGLARPLNGERILLIDDVMTTGATASATSRLLLQQGAAEVQVAVVGRALSEARR